MSRKQGATEERKRGPGVFRGSDLGGDRGRRSFATGSGRIPKMHWGPCSASSAAPFTGMRPAKDAGPPMRCLPNCDVMSEVAA